MPYEKTCISCGNEFVTDNFQKKKCSKNCGNVSLQKKRTENRKNNVLEFIGVDGEGVDRPDGKHEYVMLSVGEKTLWKEGRQLTLQEILGFLYEQYTESPNAAFIGFFLGYDFIQWEKLLPVDRAHLLLSPDGILKRKSKVQSRANPYPDAVVWEGWEIDIMAGRRFKLRPHVHHRSDYTGQCRNRTCAINLEDTTVIDEIGPIIPGEMEWEPNETGENLPFPGWDFFRRHHTVGQGTYKAEVSGWMYICDTGPFWQTSFLNVIDPKSWGDNPVCSEEQYATVKRGKADRGTIAAYDDCSYYSDMQKYNVLENDILARVTERLNKGFMNDDIPIKISKNDWYGPGRAAQLWMDDLHDRIALPDAVTANKSNGTRFRVGHPDRTNETGLLNADVYQSMPTWYVDAARSSYYGGWFEQMAHGHVGDVWEYDINSAYPFIIANLPCLHTSGPHNGVYSQGGPSETPPTDGKRYTLIHATVRGSNPYIGCMPHRTKQGNILRPHETKGWYWQHELEASKRAGLIDTIAIEEWVSYLACECPPPFNPEDIGIEQMYKLRLLAGKNSPEGKAFKLVYNSSYGKTAQSIGSPKYSNPVYASLITAGCRTLILEAIASHSDGPSACTMVATDGVYFTSRHVGLPLDVERLGAWDETFKPGMTQLMPGVYWDDETRKRIGVGASVKMKSRGVNARDLAKQIEHLDELFYEGHLALLDGREYTWPTIEFTVQFQMASAKLALQRGKWDTAGKVEHGSIRRISANPESKRNPLAYRSTDGSGITRTSPYGCAPTLASHAYEKTFGYVDWSDEYVERDGRDPNAYFRDLLQNKGRDGL